MGMHETKVDGKRRIMVPMDFRVELAREQAESLYVYPSLTHPCLEGAGYSFFQKKRDILEARGGHDPLQDAFALAWIGETIRLQVDKDGRITISEALKATSGFQADLTFVGLGEKFQLWAAEKFDEYRQEMRDLARDNLHLLGPRALTVPGVPLRAVSSESREAPTGEGEF